MKIITAKRVEIFADIGDQYVFNFGADVSDADIRAAHPGCVIKPVTFVIYESVQEMEQGAGAAHGRAALAALSSDERHALGTAILAR